MAAADRTRAARALGAVARALRTPVVVPRHDVVAAFAFALFPAVLTAGTAAPAWWPVAQAAMVLAALQALGGRGRGGAGPALMAAGGAAVLVLNVTYGVSYYLQDSGFNARFFYHLHPDVLYAGLSEFRLPAILTGLYGVAGLGALLAAARRDRGASRAGRIGAGVVLVACLVTFPPVRSMGAHVRAETVATPDPVGARIAADLTLRPAVTAPARPGNLVLIYAESLERSFFDEERFPGLLPSLTAFRRTGVEFTGVRQPAGAGWTIGGLVATQCGVPLHSRHGLGGNEFAVFSDFLPGATCLADVLREHGYGTVFLGGADARFAGKGDFLASHGYERVLGRRSLRERVDAASLHQWGLYDEALFRLGAEELERLARGDEPFALVLLTLDTHPPRGFPSPSCAPYAENDDEFLQAVHCADRLIGAFIEEVRASPAAGRTTIVVVSDHLAMRNTASGMLDEKADERALTLIVDAPDAAPGARHGAGTSFDVAPTILEALGFGVEGSWGLGRSLLGHERGLLAAAAPLDRADEAIRREPLAAVWDGLWASARSGAAGRTIRVDLEARSMEIGGARYALEGRGLMGADFERAAPVAFELDPEDLALLRVHRPAEAPAHLRRAFFEHPENLFVVAAPADAFGRLLEADPEGPRPWHVLVTVPSGEAAILRPLREPVDLSAAAIDSVLDAARSDRILAARLGALR